MIPLIWVAVGVVLVLAELASGDLVLLMLGGAALGAAGASALGAPLGVDVAAFALLAVLLVLLARPTLRRRLSTGGPLTTGSTRVLGTEGEVVDTIGGPGDEGGTVRLDGAMWSARALDTGAVLGAGVPVVVVAVDGATAVVTAARTTSTEEET